LHHSLLEQENTSLEVIQMVNLRTPEANCSHSGLMQMVRSNTDR
jgi:hypothetical protein